MHQFMPTRTAEETRNVVKIVLTWVQAMDEPAETNYDTALEGHTLTNWQN